MSCMQKKIKSTTLNIFSLQGRRLAESFEGLNSSRVEIDQQIMELQSGAKIQELQANAPGNKGVTNTFT